MIDIHCHILPGVDDGAQNEQMSMEMLGRAKALGIQHIVATPHVKRRNPAPETMAQAMAKVRDKARLMGIQVTQGYEVNLHALDPDKLENACRYCFEGSRILLLEMPVESWPVNWERIVYRLQNMGLEIVIAHPERYRPLQRDFERARALVEMGCKLQLDAEAILGFWESEQRTLGKKLLEADVVSYVASDAHHAGHYAKLEKALKKIKRVYKQAWITLETECLWMERELYSRTEEVAMPNQARA